MRRSGGKDFARRRFRPHRHANHVCGRHEFALSFVQEERLAETRVVEAVTAAIGLVRKHADRSPPRPNSDSIAAHPECFERRAIALALGVVADPSHGRRVTRARSDHRRRNVGWRTAKARKLACSREDRGRAIGLRRPVKRHCIVKAGVTGDNRAHPSISSARSSDTTSPK